MSSYKVEVSQVMSASAKSIYAVLSDYKVGHLAILPKPYFTGMSVERGGQGAGTVVVVNMRVMGAQSTYRLEVTEPHRGRVLQEVDRQTGIRTRFILEPQADGACKVTIASEFRGKPGLSGFVERLVNPPITRRIYRKELNNLADYLRH